ncbi:hypothetical protein A1Q1_02560 [Trichosporon asahii var. asahii CBS 2479]|nr:hypothetical protein A1Q1_02560 [Trichosporon asahii var. asahii CBS 2479]EJT48428.1 hypothetical protein A1Q1_02560 [Trichosporon asahii var. asahii CBS 2479]
MPPVRWVTRKMTPAEIRAAERKAVREKAAAKASRDFTLANQRNAAETRRRKVLGPSAAANDPEPYEMRAWETVCKWDDTEEKLRRPLMSRPKIPESYFAYTNPENRRLGRRLVAPRAGTREATFHSIVTSVEKQVEKPPTPAQKGKAATAAEAVEKFARTKMKEAVALFSLPDAEFETKMYALDSACLIISACIKDKSAKGTNLRKLFAQSEEWESQIRRMLDELDEEELQRLRDEENEHLPALFVSNLLDTLKYTKKPKMWPEFGTDTVKYFIDKTGGWSAEDGEQPEY